MKNRFLLTIFGLGLSLPLSSTRATTLVYSNDLLGEIEPCGCRNNPAGGMLRKAQFLKSLADQDLLQLDAGDLLFPTETLPDALIAQSELQASYLLKAMDLVHHDAVVPGEKDFALGIKGFDRLRKNTKVKFLAANAQIKGRNEFLPPYLSIKKQHLNIAILGLVGKDLGWPKELRIISPIATAKSWVPKLRKNHDLVIALTHQGFEADADLAKKVPGIDLIIGGHSQSFLQKGQKIKNTWIFQSSFRNQYVGKVTLEHPFKNQNHELVSLDSNFEPNQSTPMKALVQDFKTAIADLNSKISTSALSRLPRPGSIKFQTFPKCAECHLKQFDFWRKTQHALALEPLIKQNQSKNKECLSCHTVGLGDPAGLSDINQLAWRKEDPKPLSHDEIASDLKQIHEAKRLSTEITLSRVENKLPLRMGFSQLDRSFAPVQCENCHQPGQDHPFSGSIAKKVETSTCLNCHTAERAPEWYKADKKPDWDEISQKRTRVTCPSGEYIEEEQN